MLTSSVQGDNPNYDGKVRNGQQMGSNNGHRWHTNDHYHKRRNPTWTAAIGHPPETMDTNRAIKMATKAISQEGLMPGSMKSVSECNSECLTTSNIEEHLEEEVEPVPTSPKNYVAPLRTWNTCLSPWEGAPLVRKSSGTSHVSTPTVASETKIVCIGRRSQNKCAIITVIGVRSQKALWDSGAGRCIISYDCYNSLYTKYKTELFPSRVKIRTANGTFISNRGAYDVTFKINKEWFTFPFLSSD